MSDEINRLRAENKRLRELLAEHGIAIPGVLEKPSIPEAAERTARLTPAEKIQLFRGLFRGRDDVYAVRWESPDGRTGYSPKSERDWNAYYAAKPEERKRVDRETHKYLPLTDEVIGDHLKGQTTAGVYPLLIDETCWFLAADFDKKTWQDDASAFLASCSEWNVPAIFERSRSGKGGHVRIFFDRPVSAVLARRLGCALLTRTMERRHQVGLDSYDRAGAWSRGAPGSGLGHNPAGPGRMAGARSRCHTRGNGPHHR